MQLNQCLPTLFKPHRKWLLQVLDDGYSPKAWVLNNGRWQIQSCQKTNGLIEYFEHTLNKQDNIGVLRFAGIIDSTGQEYTIVYLYNGVYFSHTIFLPMQDSDHSLSDSKNWWIEPWHIEHLLNHPSWTLTAMYLHPEVDDPLALLTVQWLPNPAPFHP